MAALTINHGCSKQSFTEARSLNTVIEKMLLKNPDVTFQKGFGLGFYLPLIFH